MLREVSLWRDKSFKKAILVFITVKLAASFVALISWTSLPSNPIVPAGEYRKPVYSLWMEASFGVWERSDALWYIKIAKNGYNKKSSVFMPVYPLLIRIFNFVFRKWIISALLVSNISFLLALYFFHKMVEEEFGEDVASKSVWYISLFPGSIFMMAPYTEPVYLLFAVLSFYLCKRGKFVFSAISGLILSLTRNLGILIGIPLLYEVIDRVRRREIKPYYVLSLLILPWGILGYLWYCKHNFGDFLSPIHNQAGWGRSFTMPWNTIFKGTLQALGLVGHFGGGIYVMETFFSLLVIGLAVVSLWKFPPSYSLYVWLNVLPPLMAPYSGRYFMSFMRFSSVLFPIFITLALISKNKNVENFIKIFFACNYALAVTLYTTCHNMF